MQIACYLRSTYKSRLSNTYTKNGSYSMDLKIFILVKCLIDLIAQRKCLTCLHVLFVTGNSCKIPFGTGSVHGFFSQDDTKIGSAVIKQQVPSCFFVAEVLDMFSTYTLNKIFQTGFH